MTQGNCCRKAVGTLPDSAHQGRTRPCPSPCPAPTSSSPSLPPPPRPHRGPRLASLGPPSPTSSPVRRASLRKNRFPEDPEARGLAEVGADVGHFRPRLGALEEKARRGMSRARPSPASGAPRDRCRLRWELCSFSSNYLSEQRVGEDPKKGPSLQECLPISIRGALFGSCEEEMRSVAAAGVAVGKRHSGPLPSPASQKVPLNGNIEVKTICCVNVSHPTISLSLSLFYTESL